MVEKTVVTLPGRVVGDGVKVLMYVTGDPETVEIMVVRIVEAGIVMVIRTLLKTVLAGCV